MVLIIGENPLIHWLKKQSQDAWSWSIKIWSEISDVQAKSQTKHTNERAAFETGFQTSLRLSCDRTTTRYGQVKKDKSKLYLGIKIYKELVT